MSAKWTVLVYMAGNNSLSDAAGVDLQEMRQVGSSDAVQVCVFVKRADGAGAQRLIVGKGGRGESAEELGNVDSGNPQTVVDFVRWAAAKAPADRWALVLWNHGGGWRPGDLDAIYSQVRGASQSRDRRSEINARANQAIARALFTTTIEQVAKQPSRGEREICSDDATGHSLDTIELGRICKQLHHDLGQPIDVLGMDACLMSNLEVAYQIRDHVGAIVGSEEVEPGAGWPYEKVLGDLQGSPEMDGTALTRAIVQRYVESYDDQKDVWPVTQCAVSTAAISELAEPLDVLSSCLLKEIEHGWPQLLTAQQNAVHFTFDDLLDLGSLCQGLQVSALSDETKVAAQSVVAALDRYVVAERHHGDTVEGCKGVSVYFPGPTQPISKYYKDLAFSQQHNWDELLKSYAEAIRKGP